MLSSHPTHLLLWCVRDCQVQSSFGIQLWPRTQPNWLYLALFSDSLVESDEVSPSYLVVARFVMKDVGILCGLAEH